MLVEFPGYDRILEIKEYHDLERYVEDHHQDFEYAYEIEVLVDKKPGVVQVVPVPVARFVRAKEPRR